MATAERDTRLETLQWCAAEELARRWAVSTDTVLREIARGKLPATKIGRAWRVHIDDVTAYEGRNSKGRQPARRPRAVRVPAGILGDLNDDEG